MAKEESFVLNPELSKKSEQFLKELKSEMNYKSDLSGGDIRFDWLDKFEFALQYIDNIVARPKVELIKQEDIVKIDKARNTGVATVKHLAKNAHFIDAIEEETGDVKPSKLLIERTEETFNVYENRFIFTLIYQMQMFTLKKEDALDNLKIQDDKSLEYVASTKSNKEKINVELKLTAHDLSKDNDSLNKEIASAKKRIRRIKEFISIWQMSEMYVELLSIGIDHVTSPLRKTNMILRNPNFQQAVVLWDFLQMYNDKEIDKNKNKDDDGDDILKSILDDAFLMNHYVMDAAPLSRKEQKEVLAEYAVVMIHNQLNRIIKLLLDSKIKVSDQEILDMILNQIKKERTKKKIDKAELKNQFKSEMEEYLAKTQRML